MHVSAKTIRAQRRAEAQRVKLLAKQPAEDLSCSDLIAVLTRTLERTNGLEFTEQSERLRLIRALCDPMEGWE